MILRPATMDDAERLFAWRNDPETRAQSLTTDRVPWDDHVAWLERSLAMPERTLLIAEVAGTPVGTVRLDGEEMSWTVAPEHRRKGYAKEMVRLALPRDATAQIKRGNLASQKVARAAGLQLVEDGELQVWRRSCARSVSNNPLSSEGREKRSKGRIASA
jgi:RimJ/RimL family protein N-acetyltransferase